MKTNRFALRVLQNRSGLVPRPSWCTYRVRSEDPNMPMMGLEAVRRVFSELGELDLVRLCGPEPLLRPDLDRVAEAIVELSRPSVFHVSTFGQAPNAAEAFVRGFREPSILRVFSVLPRSPGSNAAFVDHRRWALALETIERLRSLAREKGFKLGILRELDTECAPVHADRLHSILGDGDTDIFVILRPLPPDSSYSSLEQHMLLPVVEAELEDGEGNEFDLARIGARYFLRGAQSRLRGDVDPRPHPKCTALRSHVRVNADGSLPTCGFYPEIVGNLAEIPFDAAWFGSEAERARGIVDGCRGCWAADEVLPSAFYSGEIVRGRRDGVVSRALPLPAPLRFRRSKTGR